MTDDVDTRRRRAAYRACHRGTKEMDWILGRFAQSVLPAMPADGLDLFERLLALPDPELQDMVLHPELAPAGEFAELVAAMRAFHGLGNAAAMTGARRPRPQDLWLQPSGELVEPRQGTCGPSFDKLRTEVVIVTRPTP